MTKAVPAKTRNVQMKKCDQSAITPVDDQTLQGTIIVDDCPCESRYSSNATRIKAVGDEVTNQLNAYMKQTHGSQSKYQCSVQYVNGNGTNTNFHYTCKAPKADHDKIKAGMQQCCTNDAVIVFFFLQFRILRSYLKSEGERKSKIKYQNASFIFA